jgi:hypothetical protein
MASQPLAQAYQLIKNGQKAQAEAQLREFLEVESDNADAWWLLANAATDPADIRQALERNLNLRPDHATGQKALAAFNRKYPPTAAAPDEDDDFDSLFAEEFVDQPKSTRASKVARKPGQSNQNWILYGSIALIVVFVCGGIGAIVMEATRVVSDVVTSNEFSGMREMLSEMSAYQQVPQEARRMGNISVGERKTATVDTFDDDVWTFEGHAGQVVIIELNARDSILDPELFLYHPSGHLVNSNDDYGSGLNSRIRHTLTANGRYPIVVSAFGGGGAYELFLYNAD